jgi:hypothetical protein
MEYIEKRMKSSKLEVQANAFLGSGGGLHV